MPELSPPPKPLKLLTIDGGGLRGLASLLILDDLMRKIQKQNNTRKPRPCEVFDVIAGVGAGGWLALLLGRFRLDVSECLLEWSRLMRAIAPSSEREIERRRRNAESLINVDALRLNIRELTRLYGTGSKLVENEPKRTVRSRYVFVAAERDGHEGQYSLFRSYDRFDDDIRRKLCPGPENPSSYSIENAFCVTGAGKYFCEPWKETITGAGERRFLDQREDKPHNITALALNEIWMLFGKSVGISAVVNVGPGVYNEADLKPLVKQFSFGLPFSWSMTQTPEEKALTGPMTLSSELTDSEEPIDELDHIDSFGSIRSGMSPSERAELNEHNSEIRIVRKLTHVYGDDGRHLYYRLAPEQSPAGSRWSDTVHLGQATGSAERLFTSAQYRETQKIMTSRFTDPLAELTVEC